MPEESSVMAQPDHPGTQPGAGPKAPPPRPVWDRALAAARARYRGSLAQSFARELQALDFSSQIMLFGAGMLVSLLPFLILLSAFASSRIDDDIALRMGLNGRASGIVTHLLTTSPASLNVATASSMLFVAAGTLAVAGSLQQIYEKAFHQEHRGLRGLYRLPVWVIALCLVMVAESMAGRPVRDAAGGVVLAELVTFAIMTPFYWWSMHFLLAGRVPWRALLPAAIATGAFFAGLGIFSKFYFSSTIISDSRTYGAIGAVFGILTWFVAIGAVLILGAVAGAAWYHRQAGQPRRALSRPGGPLPAQPDVPQRLDHRQHRYRQVEDHRGDRQEGAHDRGTALQQHLGAAFPRKDLQFFLGQVTGCHSRRAGRVPDHQVDHQCSQGQVGTEHDDRHPLRQPGPDRVVIEDQEPREQVSGGDRGGKRQY